MDIPLELNETNTRGRMATSDEGDSKTNAPNDDSFFVHTNDTNKDDKETKATAATVVVDPQPVAAAKIITNDDDLYQKKKNDLNHEDQEMLARKRLIASAGGGRYCDGGNDDPRTSKTGRAQKKPDHWAKRGAASRRKQHPTSSTPGRTSAMSKNEDRHDKAKDGPQQESESSLYLDEDMEIKRQAAAVLGMAATTRPSLEKMAGWNEFVVPEDLDMDCDEVEANVEVEAASLTRHSPPGAPGDYDEEEAKVEVEEASQSPTIHSLPGAFAVAPGEGLRQAPKVRYSMLERSAVFNESITSITSASDSAHHQETRRMFDEGEIVGSSLDGHEQEGPANTDTLAIATKKGQLRHVPYAEASFSDLAVAEASFSDLAVALPVDGARVALTSQPNSRELGTRNSEHEAPRLQWSTGKSVALGLILIMAVVLAVGCIAYTVISIVHRFAYS